MGDVMSKIDTYRKKLHHLKNLEPFLLKESGLPGPRANLELIQAVADEGTTERFLTWLKLDSLHAPAGSREEFLAACGAVGLGASIAKGEKKLWPELRASASDSRWRVREGVAMALQRIGDVDMEGLLERLTPWVKGNLLERRAVVAGLCEPRLLNDRHHAAAVLKTLDAITASIPKTKNKKDDAFRVLRQTLGYGWSVAIVADPVDGKPLMEKWISHKDTDIRWICRENLKKNRLQRIDAQWVDKMRRSV
jgi:hypothetical protein